MQCPQQCTRDQRRVIDSVFPAQADNTIHLMRTPDTTQNTGMVRVSARVYAFNTHKTNSLLAQAVCSSVTDVLEEFMDVKEKEVCKVKAQRAQYSLVGTNYVMSRSANGQKGIANGANGEGKRANAEQRDDVTRALIYHCVAVVSDQVVW